MTRMKSTEKFWAKKDFKFLWNIIIIGKKHIFIIINLRFNYISYSSSILIRIRKIHKLVFSFGYKKKKIKYKNIKHLY